MMFEMATGDFLFEPRNSNSKKFSQDDDHLAQMMELLGPMPRSMALGGIKYRKMFDRAGQLRRIRGLKYWPLHRVLHEKYKFKEAEAKAFADFLLPMLAWDPNHRASAKAMLKHPWLTACAWFAHRDNRCTVRNAWSFGRRIWRCNTEMMFRAIFNAKFSWHIIEAS